MEEIVKRLILKNKTISFMESCTGGGLANSVTNIPNSSEVLKFSAVTYSNEFKVQCGVKESTIEKYSVYSKEVAMEMSKCISDITNSNYGIGVTGKLNCQDKNNYSENDSIVYVSIYDKDNNDYTIFTIDVTDENRIVNKNKVINSVIDKLKEII